MKKLTSLAIVIILMLGILPTAQASEYMNVYSLDGRVEVIRTADFNAWHAVGWYSAPVMYVYAPDGRCEIIKISDFDAWHKVGWYSAPVMYVYAADGRKQVVLKSDAPAWKAVGWDYQTGYADNIPWKSDRQQWAIIDLKCGPYSDWRMNRNYYIDKYFIEMPLADRLNIKHYAENEPEHHMFLFVPRYKTANTITVAYVDFEELRTKEGASIWSIGSGFPFSVQFHDPPGDIHPILKIKNSKGHGFVIGQNLSDIPGMHLDDETVLDLTEWEYSPWY